MPHALGKASGQTLDDLFSLYSKKRESIPVDFRSLVPNLINPDRATHLLHPYPAKLLTHIPLFFLSSNRLCSKDELVLDPFCGSGTTLLEAQLSGRRAYGADSNPFARLLSQVKTTPIEPSSLEEEIKRASELLRAEPSSSRTPDVVNLNYWFYPHAVRDLQRAKSVFNRVSEESVRNFLRICLAACARQVSRADPRLSVPVRLRADQYDSGHPFYERTVRRLQSLQSLDPIAHLSEIIAKNSKRVASYWRLLNSRPNVEIISDDARNLEQRSANGNRFPGLPDSSIQLVITSPPYPGAQKYVRASTFALGWLDLCSSANFSRLKHEAIGREEVLADEYQSVLDGTGVPLADDQIRRICKSNMRKAVICALYVNEMREVLKELERVLKSGGYIILVAGNGSAAGIEFSTVEHLEWLAEDLGLKTALSLTDHIRSRGLMTQRNTTAGLIESERVLVLRKD